MLPAVMRQSRRTWPWLVLAGLVAAGILGPPLRQRLIRARLVRLLSSPQPQDRKRAAWSTIEHEDPAAVALLVQGLTGAEDDPDVREAYVYSLGRIGGRKLFPIVELVVRSDPSAYVRSAAWLAAARIDREQTRRLLADVPPVDTPWDRIGRARARLLTGDASAFDELLYWAEHGDAGQKVVASRGLTRWLVPVLDAVGRWPVHVEPIMGQPWPVELVREVRARCARLDLQAIAEDIVLKGRRARRVRRNVWRITHARDAIVAILYGRLPEP